MINSSYVIIQALLGKIRLKPNMKLSLAGGEMIIALIFQNDKKIMKDFFQGIIRWNTVAKFLTRLDMTSESVTGFVGTPDESFDAF